MEPVISTYIQAPYLIYFIWCRIFDVQRQASTSSNTSSHSGIDIVMGEDSDSEIEDIEISK